MSKKICKIDKKDLNEIRSLAKSYYIDEANSAQLSADEFNSQCYVKAVLHYLTSKGEDLSHVYDFPSRKPTESIEND